MVVRSVNIVPVRTVSLFHEKALRMASRHDLDFVLCRHEAFGERSRVILHAADVVAGNGDDADPHGPRMLPRRQGSSSAH
jgi:hypothetical protein